jgi:hypothetical protein
VPVVLSQVKDWTSNATETMQIEQSQKDLSLAFHLQAALRGLLLAWLLLLLGKSANPSWSSASES